MPPLFPQKIIENPYHSTMLTLLRQVTTLPCDLVSPALPASSRHRLKLYACYQQHLNPKINMPILTLVAPCGTSIMPPTMRRNSPSSVDLEFTVSTEHQQEYFALTVPLLMTHTVFCHPNIRTSKQLSGHVHILHHQGSRSTAQSSLDQSLPDVGHWMCYTPHTIYLLTSETRRRIRGTHPRHLWNKDSSLLHHSTPIGQPYDAVLILH